VAAAAAIFASSAGVNSMMVALFVAGIGILLAGLLAVGYGIPVKEFSFGNTLIVSGAITACTGAIMLALWAVARELKVVARRFGPDPPTEAEAVLQPAGRTPRNQNPEDGFLFNADQPAADNAGQADPAATSPPPWSDEASRGRSDSPAAPEQAEAAPAVKPRRNLLFSSSSRKERERALARAADPSDPGAGPDAPAPAPPPLSEPPPATFDDAWPKSERARATEPPPPRRSMRTPTAFNEAAGAAPAADRHPPAVRKEDAPEVTVLKSGVVDGMAYSLYSDGSIEAQMPEGMMRFASIDELRAHLDQRP
jgi:hypothetical protein